MVLNQIKQDFHKTHLGRVLKYISQPSVSASNLGILEMAKMLSNEINELGGKSKIIQTNELPIIFGKMDGNSDKTLVFHGLYDVAPADEPTWQTSPFTPEIGNVEGVGLSVLGRGAEDMKTPIALVMNVIQAYRENDLTLPINLMFVLEASELGSGGIKEFIPRFKSELIDADAVLWLCPMANSDGTPIIPLSVKGNLMGKLICKGGKWRSNCK